MSTSIKNIIAKLDKQGCFQIRNEPITLKSGKQSNLYLDLRLTFGNPVLLDEIASQLYITLMNTHSTFNMSSLLFEMTKDFIEETCICGLPYGAMPLATALSLKSKLGLILLRKEAKTHGTKKLVEGMNDKYKRVIIIDDVMTSGISIVESVNVLKDYFEHIDIFVVCDREGEHNPAFKEVLTQYNINIKSLFKLRDLPERYLLDSTPKSLEFRRVMHEIQQRFANSSNSVKKLVSLMFKKHSNLVVSVDESDPMKAMKIIEEVAEHAVCIKLHYDILNFKNSELSQEEWFINLDMLSKSREFCIFEDRKFMDIGNTVKKQYSKILNTYESLDFVNATIFSGESIVQSLMETSAPTSSPTSLLLLAEMSSKNNLFGDNIVRETLKICKKYKNYISGVVCQSRKHLQEISEDLGEMGEMDGIGEMLYFTPGVNLNANNDDSGQQYRTIHEAILRDECDLIIVGRGITENKFYNINAKIYKEEGWRCYLERYNKL